MGPFFTGVTSKQFNYMLIKEKLPNSCPRRRCDTRIFHPKHNEIYICKLYRPFRNSHLNTKCTILKMSKYRRRNHRTIGDFTFEGQLVSLENYGCLIGKAYSGQDPNWIWLDPRQGNVIADVTFPMDESRVKMHDFQWHVQYDQAIMCSEMPGANRKTKHYKVSIGKCTLNVGRKVLSVVIQKDIVSWVGREIHHEKFCFKRLKLTGDILIRTKHNGGSLRLYKQRSGYTEFLIFRTSYFSSNMFPGDPRGPLSLWELDSGMIMARYMYGNGRPHILYSFTLCTHNNSRHPIDFNPKLIYEFKGRSPVVLINTGDGTMYLTTYQRNLPISVYRLSHDSNGN